MSPALKFLVGIVAVAGMTWLNHGPLGNGTALVDGVEARAKQAVSATEVPGINVTLEREPLSRLATLSGNADAFQREGQGEMKGLNDHVRDVEGVSGVRWPDEPDRVAIPLLAETLAWTLAAFLLGVALAWLLWRRKDEGRHP
ncbi:MAG: hypothetical protein H0W74_00395 [Sphingosinicella sp.]|nr:hypothetical protein [Sphingosinicella sp.]